MNQEIEATDLGAVPLVGPDGVVWALEPRFDLNANLVRLAPGGSVGEHRNTEVDVVVVVLAGAGTVTADGRGVDIGADHLVVIPRGAARSIAAGDQGLLYVTVHRQRGPLQVTRR